MANWLDLSASSNLFKSLYIKGFVDISGGDFISRNGNLNIILAYHTYNYTMNDTMMTIIMQLLHN
jgi:hypothetical protein